MKNLLGIVSFIIVLSGCAAPLTTREKGALTGGALGALGGGLIGDQMYGQEQQQRMHDYELEAQRREIERQRRELEELRRDRYRSDPYYYDRGYNRYDGY